VPIKISDVSEVVKLSYVMLETTEGTQKLDFAYKPNAYTPEHERRSQEARDSGVNSMVLVTLLVPTLEWVDVVDDDGVRMPVDEDHLAMLPVKVLSELIGKINEEMDPGKSKNSASRGSFKA
jgi:hypothetical protein